MKGVPGSIVVALIALLFSFPARAAGQKHPSILFLVADEYRHDCLGVEGHPIIKTPNFDRLATGGVRFTEAYAASPVCSPSRATLFTGRYPQIHGVRSNNLPFAAGEVTLPQILRANGYTTGIVGKIHLQGYRDWFDYNQIDTAGNSPEYREFLHDNGKTIQGSANVAAVKESLVKPDRTPLRIGTSVLPEYLYPEVWEADRAIDFLKKQKGQEKPWFLYLSMLKPHSEFVIPAPFDTMYPAKDMPLPRTFKPNMPMPRDFRAAGEDELAGRKTKGKSNPRRDNGPGSPGRLFINDPDILREVIGHYYGAVTLVDKHMGRVIAAMEQLGFGDDTIVLFTSDHGNMLGERNRMFKAVMYESSARVPMLCRGPGVPAGKVIDAPFDNSAVMPTLLELAGLPIPAGVQGKSLVPLMQGKGPGPEAAYSYLSDKMVRHGDYKLIVPLDRKGGSPELYNVVKDPDEQENLYGKPEVADVQKKLAAMMDAWNNQHPAKVELPKGN